MTNTEWDLKKENVALRKQMAQMLFNAADAEDKALGTKWEAPAAPPQEPQV